MAEKKTTAEKKKASLNNKTQHKSNNNLLYILFGLVLIIVSMLLYINSGREAPSSLIAESTEREKVRNSTISTIEQVSNTSVPVTEVIQQTEQKPKPTSEKPATKEKNTIQTNNQEKKPLVAQVTKTSSETKPATKQYVGKPLEYSYNIKPKETLFSVSQRFNMNREEFKRINKLTDNNLKDGQEVTIRIKAIHYIAPGEGLKAISEKYQVSKEKIMRANGLTNESIRANQQLIIPLP